MNKFKTTTILRRAGPAPGSAFSLGQRFFRGCWGFGVIEELDGVGAFGGIRKWFGQVVLKLKSARETELGSAHGRGEA